MSDGSGGASTADSAHCTSLGGAVGTVILSGCPSGRFRLRSSSAAPVLALFEEEWLLRFLMPADGNEAGRAPALGRADDGLAAGFCSASARTGPPDRDAALREGRVGVLVGS